MRLAAAVLVLLWGLVPVVLGQNPFYLDPLAQLVQNVTNITTAKYKSSQLYSLVFILDGRSGDGLFEEKEQVRAFTGYMINLTAEFAPDFVSYDDIRNVTTKCRYRRQNSYDGDIALSTSYAAAKQSSQTIPAKQADDDEIDDETLDQLIEVSLKLANTTYQYEFSMNYSSDFVDVMDYPAYYEQIIHNSKPAIAELLKTILNVKPGKTLTVLGLYTSWEKLLANALNQEIFGTNATLYPVAVNGTMGNLTDSPSITDPPTTSPIPSSQPSYSFAPTITPSPTNLPSITPTYYPTGLPSVSPTMFPTFFTNSSSRGRFELSFTVTGNRSPDTMFVNQTQFCRIMTSFNKDIKEPEHDLDQIDTTCPQISGIYTSVPIVTLPPALAPAIIREDGEYANETIAPSSTAVPTELGTSEATGSNSAERVLLRGRFLQETTDASNGTDIFPLVPTQAPTRPIATVLWRYTIVMRYTSSYWNVSQYPLDLEAFINTDEGKKVLEEEFELKYNLTDSNVSVVSFILFNDVTEAPSLAPSEMPSENPTTHLTLEPTWLPTVWPTISSAPTVSAMPTGLNRTTGVPGMPTVANSSFAPSTTANMVPTTDPPTDQNDGSQTTVIVVVVVVILVACAVMAGMFSFYQKRKKELEAYKTNAENRRLSQTRNSVDHKASTAVEEHGPIGVSTAATMSPSVDLSPRLESKPSNSSTVGASVGSSNYASNMSITVPHHEKNISMESVGMESVTSSSYAQSAPSRSMLSDIAEDPQSTVTDLVGGDDDDDDDDDEVYSGIRSETGPPPLDPFEQYHDHNLEKMRSDVEENVAGLDGMMSQAMTRALMDTSRPSPKDTSPWHGAKTGVEIEVIVLWEVTEWIRRHGGVEEDQKQEYMQEMLNKMVTSVRKGFVDPEVASRSIHECAHLLGLELANQLPSGTILLSGMQKTTTTDDVIRTFKKFGPIDDAAVAPKRGFGLVRFRNPKHTEAAMFQHNTSEVVVKDVGITMKLL